MSTNATEPPSPDDHDKARRELLLKVYDAAINEYRLNVQLGWDRNTFFIGLSVTMIGAGVGLMRLAEGSMAVSIFLFLFFLLLVAITVAGWRATEKSKRYSRCLVPGFDGALFSPEWKAALWAKVCMGAPARRRQCVERSSIVQRA